MGRVSTKENKNIYQTTREALHLTRETAGELLETIPPERIEKIENERSLPHPDEVLTMADKYKQPGLCNYYCANQCPIGQEYVPEVKIKDLSQIVLEMLASLNSMNRRKERLIEITADGVISDDELEWARRSVVSTLLTTLDTQSRLEDYWLGQSAAGLTEAPDELAERVEHTTREQVTAAARKLTLDTVYFLKGKE